MNSLNIPQHVEASALAALQETRNTFSALRERQQSAGAALRAGLLDSAAERPSTDWQQELEARLQRRESVMQAASDALQTTVLRDLASALDTAENLRRFQAQQARAHYDTTHSAADARPVTSAGNSAPRDDVIDVQAKPVVDPPV